MKNRSKIEKIYKQIDKLAVKGKDYIYDYYKLVDEFVDKGDYVNFCQCLFYYYDINVDDVSKSKLYSTVKDIKKNTWSDILFKTNNTLSKKISKLFTSKELYQMGFDIYQSGDLLGQIEEKDLFIEDVKYYILSKDFAKVLRARTSYLKVNKNSYEFHIFSNEAQMVSVFDITGTYSISNDVCNWVDITGLTYHRGVTFSSSALENQSLLNKYTVALDYLLI